MWTETRKLRWKYTLAGWFVLSLVVVLWMGNCTPPPTPSSEEKASDATTEVRKEPSPEPKTEPVKEPILDIAPEPQKEPSPEPTVDSDASTPEPDSTPEPIQEQSEPTKEVLPEPDSSSPCPPGFDYYSLPGSFDMGRKLNVKRCVQRSSGSGCTTVNKGDAKAVRFVFVGCGFDPVADRKRYNALVQRIVEGFRNTEPFKSMGTRFTIVRNDDLETGFKHTHRVRYCSEAWVNATGIGANAKPNWSAKHGVWYNTTLLNAGKACNANITLVLANNSGWAGGSHNNWRGSMSIVGSGTDDQAVRRKRKGTEAVCKQWMTKYPGRCKWEHGACFCDDDLPENVTGLPDNPKHHPNCTLKTPQFCPWPFTHPDVFMEYTALHEMAHTFAGFAHPSTGTKATPVTQSPPNCYLPPKGSLPDASKPCKPWDNAAHKSWVLPQDSKGREPRTFGCYKGCADNLNLYAPWKGTQMMIRDDELRYGFSPVERKLLQDRLNAECWVFGQKNPANPQQVCGAGPKYNLQLGTGMIYR